MVALTSAAGLVGFLAEPDQALQAFALERLNNDIDAVWTEVSGSIGQMYVLRSLSCGWTLLFGDDTCHPAALVLEQLS